MPLPGVRGQRPRSSLPSSSLSLFSSLNGVVVAWGVWRVQVLWAVVAAVAH